MSENEARTRDASKSRVLVFSGHRIDAPGRPSPRFPNDAAERATEMIRVAVAQEKELAGDAPVTGYAGAASGGDIIFHEICEELGIPTRVMLAAPPDIFAARSVDDAGPEWTSRFRRLCQTHPVSVLAEREEVSRDHDGGSTVWERANLWILESALSIENADRTLIVLWDGRGGDGPGGTADMVQMARARGVKVVHLDPEPLAQQPELPRANR